MRGIGEEGTNAVNLVALDVHEKHVGSLFPDLHRELFEQAGLQRPDADDEKRAETDGQQDDARLISRTRQVQHRVAERKRTGPGQRSDRANEPAAGGLQRESDPAEARADDQAHAKRRHLPRRQRDERGRHEHHRGDARPIETGRQRFVAEEQRGSDEPYLQQGHDREQQRDEHADPDALRRGIHGHPVLRLGEQRRRPVEHEGHGRDRGARQRHAEQTPCEAERHHLQHVDADDLPAAGADALEHGNAADLLVHEDPRDARHRDPAENHDHQADHAEIVLGALEVPADLVVGAPVRSNIHELVREAVAQRGDQRLDAIFGQAHGENPANPAAEAHETCCGQVRRVDEDARPEAEPADPAAGLIQNDTANREGGLSNDDLIAHLQCQRRQQLGTNQRAAVVEQRV